MNSATRQKARHGGGVSDGGEVCCFGGSAVFSPLLLTLSVFFVLSFSILPPPSSLSNFPVLNLSMILHMNKLIDPHGLQGGGVLI